MIDQPHGRSKPRMQDRFGKERSIDPSQSIHKLQAGFAELGKNLVGAALVVSRFVSFSIA
jgi:hypothetical protein